jgi:hypothetical protein
VSDNETKWKALTAPFADDEIELLPKPFRKDAERGKCERPDRNGQSCGGYHGLPAVHLTYVGHAGITMRLNEVVGPEGWSWEPLAYTEHGTPLFSDGGMWIRLTVLGQSRIGYGDAQGKTGPNAVKEVIGDAIRNAAMRFGVGTYLWSKSERASATAIREGATEDPPAPPPLPDPLLAVKTEIATAAKTVSLMGWDEVAADYAKAMDGRTWGVAGEPELREYLKNLQGRAA